MKNIILFFTLIILSISCTAQRITLLDSVTLQLPKTMLKVSRENIPKLAAERFGKTKYIIRNILYNPGKVYTVDDIVVFINSAKMPKEKGKLKVLKLGFDDNNENNKNYSSKIETIDGKDVAIINEITEGLNVFRFVTVNPAEDFCIIGFVQYNPKDYSKAKVVLEDIIKGLKYK
ncbi:hypothetical protein ACVWYN_000493 [Pedobacter sp. UYP24]